VSPKASKVAWVSFGLAALLATTPFVLLCVKRRAMSASWREVKPGMTRVETWRAAGFGTPSRTYHRKAELFINDYEVLFWAERCQMYVYYGGDDRVADTAIEYTQGRFYAYFFTRFLPAPEEPWR